MRATLRCIAIVAATALLSAAMCILPRRLVFEGGISYTFFTGTTSADCREIRTDGKHAALTRLTLRQVCGESATFDNLDIQKFLEEVDGKVLFREELSDSINYYCSADLPYSVQLYGQTVNLHICVRKDCIKVATPIIFGGY